MAQPGYVPGAPRPWFIVYGILGGGWAKMGEGWDGIGMASSVYDKTRNPVYIQSFHPDTGQWQTGYWEPQPEPVAAPPVAQPAPAAPSPVGETIVTQEGHGQTFTAQSGSVVTLKLPVTGEPGYEWQASVADPSVAFPTSMRVEMSPAGDSTLQVTEFLASAPGTSVLQAVLRRPSEDAKVAPKAAFQATLTVR